MGTELPGSAWCGAKKTGDVFNRSRTWGHRLLKQWWREQEQGGPQRVWRFGKRGLYRTTIAILTREFPGAARDKYVERKLAELDKDMDFMAQRVNKLAREIVDVQVWMKKHGRPMNADVPR